MDKIQMFFKKSHIIYVIIFVVSARFYVSLVKLRIFPILYEFGVPAGAYPLMWFIRELYKEYSNRGG